MSIDSNTKLLLEFKNIDDGASVIVDEGTENRFVTLVGNVLQSSTQKKFGNTSGYFSGTTDRLTVPYANNLNPFYNASHTMTISLFVKLDNHTATSAFCGFYNTSSFMFSLTHVHGSGLNLIMDTGGGGQEINIVGGEIADNDWHHVAMVRVIDDFQLYLDGTAVANRQNMSTQLNNPSATFEIGSIAAGNLLNGYMAHLHYEDDNIFGADPTNSGDTITVPTSAPVATANTRLLLNFQTPDLSSNYHSVTGVATTQIDSSTVPVVSGLNRCIQFDGNSDYLQIPDHADWDIFGDANNKTVEAYVKHTDHAGTEDYFAQGENGANVWAFGHIHGTGLYAKMVGAASVAQFTGSEITDTNWHHIALIKVGSTYGIYLDGVQVAYTSDADTDTFTGVLQIGNNTPEGGHLFDGRMTMIRLYHGNPFGAAPNATPNDTIQVPTRAYSAPPQGGVGIGSPLIF